MTKWLQLLVKGLQTMPTCRPAPENALSTEAIECGDLTINAAERIATLRSHELQLTSEEFDCRGVVEFIRRKSGDAAGDEVQQPLPLQRAG